MSDKFTVELFGDFHPRTLILLFEGVLVGGGVHKRNKNCLAPTLYRETHHEQMRVELYQKINKKNIIETISQLLVKDYWKSEMFLDCSINIFLSLAEEHKTFFWFCLNIRIVNKNLKRSIKVYSKIFVI